MRWSSPIPKGATACASHPEWIHDADAGAGLADIWFLAPTPVGEFGSNVNVIVQDVDSVGLDDYMKASLDNLAAFIDDPVVRSHTRVAAPDGAELGRIEYTGIVDGQRLSFLQYIDVDDGTAVVATLTAAPEDFDDLSATVAPFLATVEAD